MARLAASAMRASAAANWMPGSIRSMRGVLSFRWMSATWLSVPNKHESRHPQRKPRRRMNALHQQRQRPELGNRLAAYQHDKQVAQDAHDDSMSTNAAR